MVVVTLIIAFQIILGNEFDDLSKKISNGASLKKFDEKTVAVLKFDFEGKNQNSVEIITEVQKLIKMSLLKENKFIIVGRDVLNKIEQEVYAKQSNGLTNSDMRAKIGKGFGVKGVISGVIRYKKNLKYAQIFAELTDTETHETIASAEIITTRFNKELDNSIVKNEMDLKALGLSTLLPGVGQMYKGKSLRGAIF